MALALVLIAAFFVWPELPGMGLWGDRVSSEAPATTTTPIPVGVIDGLSEEAVASCIRAERELAYSAGALEGVLKLDELLREVRKPPFTSVDTLTDAQDAGMASYDGQSTLDVRTSVGTSQRVAVLDAVGIATRAMSDDVFAASHAQLDDDLQATQDLIDFLTGLFDEAGETVEIACAGMPA